GKKVKTPGIGLPAWHAAFFVIPIDHGADRRASYVKERRHGGRLLRETESASYEAAASVPAFFCVGSPAIPTAALV
ncbi:MAG TPA: hypothetical protein VGH29_09400, partial [Candidatus Binataceae bacterium]